MSDRGKSCEASGTRDRVLEGQRSGMETEMKVNGEFYVYKVSAHLLDTYQLDDSFTIALFAGQLFKVLLLFLEGHMILPVHLVSSDCPS